MPKDKWCTNVKLCHLFTYEKQREKKVQRIDDPKSDVLQNSPFTLATVIKLTSYSGASGAKQGYLSLDATILCVFCRQQCIYCY